MFDRLLPLPIKKFATTALAPVKFPVDVFPVTLNELNVPTLVMFGCAFVVTVPAVVALVAHVALVALPASNAYVAFATVPVTLAPVS